MNTYQKIIHKSRYAKYIPQLERREEWPETVERYVGFFKEKFGKVFPEQLIRDSILQTRVMPSMRGIMTAGEALKRDELAVFNCAYLPLTSTSDYRDLTYILMLGTGVGFSCESKFVNQFPAIENFNANHTIGIKEALVLSAEFTIEDGVPMYLVQDTKYGWAESNMYLLNCLLKGYVPNISYEKVRPKGARLVTFGGRASGPEPLKECHRKIIKLFAERQGNKLRSIDAHDIACFIAESIVVGGVRRSAMISLSDLEDKEMALSKHGDWWTFNQQRALANNSAVWERPLTKDQFFQEWDMLKASGSGERGIFSRYGSIKNSKNRVLDSNCGTNPCGEIILRPYQTCNLSEVIIRPTDTKEDIKRKVEIATIIGTFQSCFDNFPYVNPEWEKSQREDRLLGVSLTGIMQNGNTINPDIDFLEYLNKSAAIVNAEYADKLGIKRSAAITCIKPSGTVSQLCGTSSGIHPVYANRYVRRIRMDKKDPLTNYLVEQGLEFEEDVFNKENLIFPFYKEEEGVNRNDITAIGQLELYLKYKKHYTDHNVSNTIYVGDGEWVSVGNWVYNNQTEINGLSFLPRDNHTYVQAPYTEVSERLSVNNKDVDFSGFYEFEDLTTASQEYACAGGSCELK